MARLVMMVLREILDQMPALKTPKLQFLNSAPVKLVLESLALVDPPDNQVSQETLAVPETTVLLVLLDKQVMLVHKVHLALLDLKDHQEPPDNKQKEELDQLDHQAHLVHKDPQDQLANLDNLHRVLKDHLAHKVHLDLLDNPEATVDLDHLDHLEKLVALAPATTVRHLDWPQDTKRRSDIGHGFDTALLLCCILSFFKVTL